jgi:hypothetical protein
VTLQNGRQQNRVRGVLLRVSILVHKQQERKEKSSLSGVGRLTPLTVDLQASPEI